MRISSKTWLTHIPDLAYILEKKPSPDGTRYASFLSLFWLTPTMPEPGKQSNGIVRSTENITSFLFCALLETCLITKKQDAQQHTGSVLVLILYSLNGSSIIIIIQSVPEESRALLFLLMRFCVWQQRGVYNVKISDQSNASEQWNSVQPCGHSIF